MTTNYWKPCELDAQIKEEVTKILKEKGMNTIETIEMPQVMFHEDEEDETEYYLVEGNMKIKADNLLIEVKDVSIKLSIEKRISIDIEVPSYTVDGEDEVKLDLKLTTSFLI